MHWSQSQPQQQLHFLSTFYMPGSTPTPCIHLLSSAKTQYNSCALAFSRCSVNAQGMNGCMWYTSCWILLHNRVEQVLQFFPFFWRRGLSTICPKSHGKKAMAGLGSTSGFVRLQSPVSCSSSLLCAVSSMDVEVRVLPWVGAPDLTSPRPLQPFPFISGLEEA